MSSKISIIIVAYVKDKSYILIMDIIAKLQEAAFATRLKRLADNLWKDVTVIYQELGIDCDDRWFPMLYALHLKSPQSITILAKSLLLSHTAINQLSKEMVKKGLLSTFPSKKDKRKRFLGLTAKGQNLIESLIPVWDEIGLATRDWIAESGQNVMEIITDLENSLEQKNMYERVWIRLKGYPPRKIEFMDYSPAMKKHFRLLYAELLTDKYEIEEVDEKLLNDPNRKIIKKGGSIIFASLNDEIVGTCAAMHHRGNIYEVTALVVKNHARQVGIGSLLLEKIIVKSREAGAEILYFQIDPELKPALQLIERFGFKPATEKVTELVKINRYTVTMCRSFNV